MLVTSVQCVLQVLLPLAAVPFPVGAAAGAVGGPASGGGVACVLAAAAAGSCAAAVAGGGTAEGTAAGRILLREEGAQQVSLARHLLWRRYGDALAVTS